MLEFLFGSDTVGVSSVYSCAVVVLLSGGAGSRTGILVFLSKNSEQNSFTCQCTPLPTLFGQWRSAQADQDEP